MKPQPGSLMGVVGWTLLGAALLVLPAVRPALAQGDSTLQEGRRADTAPQTPAGYRVELDAPKDLRPLLTENLDLYRWRSDPKVGEAQLRFLVNEAPAQVRELIETEGYYTPKVSAEFQREDGGRLVKLRVEPGEPVRVSGLNLRLSGPQAAEPAAGEFLARLRRDWTLKPGQRFRDADWEAAKRKALLALLGGAYPAARIAESQARVDVRTDEVQLKLVLDSGPAFTFGKLEVTGLKRYPITIVQRLNPIRPGDAYSESKLLDLQSRLRNSPYFSSASVRVDTDPARPKRVPVQVTVKERPSEKLGFGLGASTDAGARGSIQYSDLNLLHRAWHLSANLTVDVTRQILGVDLVPPLTPLGYRDSLHAQVERTDIEDQVTRSQTVGVKRTRVRKAVETVASVDFTNQRQEVAGSVTDTNQALVAGYTWTWRRADDLIYPTRGYILSLQAAGAARVLLSDQDFLRGYGRAAWFHPLGARDGVILRGEAGAVLSRNRQGIPSDYLFRTGGDQTVRGYAYQSLGVREGDAIVGGRYLVVASAEYVHWFKPKWGGAVFMDAGDAADEPGALSLHRGYGLGVRWKSPVGPLNLDLARGVDGGGVRFHFSASLVF